MISETRTWCRIGHAGNVKQMWVMHALMRMHYPACILNFGRMSRGRGNTLMGVTTYMHDDMMLWTP